MNRRDAIRMTDTEIGAFLAEQRTVTCASLSADGRPHLMPLWFVLEGDELVAWTYGKSQKTQNLRRDPRATLQVEAGESYDQLRGVMIEADTELVEVPEQVKSIGLRIALRYAGGELSPAGAPPELRAFVARQAPKRVGLRFRPTRTVSWDHRKLVSRDTAAQ